MLNARGLPCQHSVNGVTKFIRCNVIRVFWVVIHATVVDQLTGRVEQIELGRSLGPVGMSDFL